VEIYGNFKMVLQGDFRI